MSESILVSLELSFPRARTIVRALTSAATTGLEKGEFSASEAHELLEFAYKIDRKIAGSVGWTLSASASEVLQ